MKNRTKIFTVRMALLLAGIFIPCAGVWAQDAQSLGDGVNGTATGVAKGFDGDVSVTITVTNGIITDCVVEGPGETPAIGGLVLESAPDSIKALNSPDIEAVAGATITVEAIKAAAKAAIDQIVG